MPALRLLPLTVDVLEEERCDSDEVLPSVERLSDAFLLAGRQWAEEGRRPRLVVSSDGQECRKAAKSSGADE